MLNSIVCVLYHTICISSEGNVYSVGGLEQGIHGHSTNVTSLTRIPSLTQIKSVSSYRQTLCLDFDGNVFIFGSNRKGALGIGIDQFSLDHIHTPHKLELPPIKHISVGLNFSMCVSENNELYSFGDNIYGNLGLGDVVSRNFPQKIESLANVDYVECGSNHTICKTLNNEIYCWGHNEFGQLGVGHSKNILSPFLTNNIWPDEVIMFKCGFRHTLALNSYNEVYSCGLNSNGQLGRIESVNNCKMIKIDGLNDIVRLECGYYHSICIDGCGQLFVFGKNYSGELGLRDIHEIFTPIKHPSLSNIIDISSRGNHSFVKTSNNEIYAFGYNKYSQLGIETEDDEQFTPIRVFEDNGDIWKSNIKSTAKSARSINTFK